MFGRGRLDHFALEAASLEAFTSSAPVCSSAAPAASSVTDFGPVLSLFFRDPDGLEGEVTVQNPDAVPGIFHPPGTPAPRYVPAPEPLPPAVALATWTRRYARRSCQLLGDCSCTGRRDPDRDRRFAQLAALGALAVCAPRVPHRPRVSPRRRPAPVRQCPDNDDE